jgi:hypothetical protein
MSFDPQAPARAIATICRWPHETLDRLIDWRTFAMVPEHVAGAGQSSRAVEECRKAAPVDLQPGPKVYKPPGSRRRVVLVDGFDAVLLPPPAKRFGRPASEGDRCPKDAAPPWKQA